MWRSAHPERSSIRKNAMSLNVWGRFWILLHPESIRTSKLASLPRDAGTSSSSQQYDMFKNRRKQRLSPNDSGSFLSLVHLDRIRSSKFVSLTKDSGNVWSSVQLDISKNRSSWNPLIDSTSWWAAGQHDRLRCCKH